MRLLSHRVITIRGQPCTLVDVNVAERGKFQTLVAPARVGTFMEYWLSQVVDVGESCIRQSGPYTNSYEHMSCSWPLICADSMRPDTFMKSWFESFTGEPLFSMAPDLDVAPG